MTRRITNFRAGAWLMLVRVTEMHRSLALRFFAILDLLRRYAAVLRAAWRVRKGGDPHPRLPHEAAFLPAALELQETPVSPAPRIARGC